MEPTGDLWKNWGPDFPDALLIHATAVAWDGKAALLLGPSGSGKSDTALQLMAYGCDLISDDRVELWAEDRRLIAHAPPAIAGQIEARGFGILPTPYIQQAEVAFAVELSRDGEVRFPRITVYEVLQTRLRVYVKTYTTGLAAALFHLLRNGPMNDLD